MKIGIISVGVNCLKESQQTIDSINTVHDYEVIFIDNGSTDGTKDWLASRDDIISYKNPIVSGLAGCWNLGLNRARADGCDLFLVINNDIVLAKNTIDNLVKRFEESDIIMATGVNDQTITPEEMINLEKEYIENETINSHPDFSCFMINKACLDKVGFFDENFRVAYFEDNSYHADIALAGLGEKAISIVSATYYHIGSQTSKNNPHLASIIEKAFNHNKKYFINKYGCEPKGDIENMISSYYKHPFNDERDTYQSFKEKKSTLDMDSIW